MDALTMAILMGGAGAAVGGPGGAMIGASAGLGMGQASDMKKAQSEAMDKQTKQATQNQNALVTQQFAKRRNALGLGETMESPSGNQASQTGAVLNADGSSTNLLGLG